ncbi:MAG TPA: hypothetical protein DHW77_08085 [Verrucomicrobiales bacterium]|nr:hypothetical protein [Verrucomicrobiales bacterium]
MKKVAGKVKKRSREATSQPTVLLFREKLLVFGAIGAVLLLPIGMHVRSSKIAHREMLQQRVKKWKSKYELTDAQAAELLEMEYTFHVGDGIFSIKTKRSAEEIEAHKQAINAKLGKVIQDH